MTSRRGGAASPSLMRSFRRDDSITLLQALAGHHPADRRVRPAVPPAAGGLPGPDRRRRPARRGQPADLPGDHRRRHPAREHRAHRRARARPRRPRDRRRRAVAVAALDLGADRRGPDLRHAHAGLRPRPGDADLVLHPHPDRRARVSRLNNDVLDAQQAFTDTLSSVVGNVDRRRRHPDRDVLPVVADHAGRAGAAAGLHPAGALGRPADPGDHPRELQPQRADEHDDDRAVQRVGRAARQAVRPARRRDRGASRTRPAASATSASRRRCTRGSSWRRCC